MAGLALDAEAPGGWAADEQDVGGGDEGGQTWGVDEGHMNEATKAEVMAAVAKWRPRLRLMDWSISYEFNAKLDDDTAMSSSIQSKYRRLCLLVKDDTKGSHWQTVEKMVVHELCHAVIEEPVDTVTEMLNGFQVGRLTFDALDTAMRLSNERATEWLARIVFEAYEGTAWDAEPPS